MIHGLPTGLIKTSSKYEYDWTDGCIALTNEQVFELADLVAVGTRVVVF